MRLDISPRLAATLLALMVLYMADSWHVILADGAPVPVYVQIGPTITRW